MVIALLQKDSVFSKFSEPPSIPKEVAKDKSFLSEDQIKDELSVLEKKAASLFNETYNNAIAKAIKDISSKENPLEAIKSYKWSLSIELNKNLLGQWLLGIGRGNQHGEREIAIASDPNAKFAQRMALFREDPKIATIRNRPAEKAIRERNKKLASDVTNSEWKKIQSALIDAVKPTSPTDPPISRPQLLKRIDRILKEKAKAFPRRAEKIARTELTFAYNTGRVQSYIESGLVAGVKFISILDGRRCPFCESRHGIVVALENARALAKIFPPIHTLCRCVLSPVLKTKFDSESKERSRQIENRNVLTENAPWMMAAILAAILVPVAAKSVARKVAQTTTQTILPTVAATKAAKAKQEVTEKSSQDVTKSTFTYPKVVKPAWSRAVPRRSKFTDPPIMLTGKINLQTATYAQLRSILPASVKDKTIHRIIDYRNKNRITSVDDLRNVIGVGTHTLKPFQVLGRQHQIFTFIDPSINQSGLVLWAKSGNVLRKADAIKVHNIVSTKDIRNLAQLEEAFEQNGLNKSILKKLQKLAEQEKQQQLEALRQSQTTKGGAIVRVGKGGAIAPIARTVSKNRQQLKYIKQSRGRRLSIIDSTLTDIEGQIGLLDSRTRLGITRATRKSGVQSVVNESKGAVDRARAISGELVEEIKPYNAQVTALNARVKDLEDKLAALLNPAVDDYFAVRPGIVDDINREINAIRGQINKVNRFANLETRAAADRARTLRTAQKQIKKSLPDYSSIQASIESQLQEVSNRISVESLRVGGSSVSISALRARYRSLESQLDQISSIRKAPLATNIADKKEITQYLGQAKRSAKNLSNRLANLENRIDKLPTRVGQLSDRVRKAYRKMPTTLTRDPNYVAPARTAPGAQGRQARLVKASRRSRQSDLNRKVDVIRTNAQEAATNADNQFFETKNWKRQPIKQQIDNRVDSYRDQLTEAIRLRQNTAIASRKASTVVTSIEESVDELAARIQADIYEPLGDNWFTTKGIINSESRRATNQLKRKIKQEINEIDKALSRLKVGRTRATNLKKEIIEIRNKANAINISPEVQQQLKDKVDNLVAELEGVTKFEVGATYYNSSLGENLRQLKAISSGSDPILKSQVKDKLDKFLIKIESLEGSLTQASNAGSVSSLTQARSRLDSQLSRIGKFPKRVRDLPEAARIEWDEIRGLRDQTRKAKQKLDRSVKSFQNEARSQGGKLSRLTESIDDAVADMETLTTGDSTRPISLYRDELQNAIRQQEEKVKIAIADLDDNLKLLRLANDTERGLELVYADLKRVYDNNIPGLDILNKPFPVGLDEAVEVKRQVIRFLKKRGVKLTKKVEAYLKENPALNAAKYKKAVVDGQIEALEELQKAIANQKPLAEDIEAKLKGVFFADPVYHLKLKPTKILEDVQQSALNQATGIKKQVTRLKNIQTELTDDINHKFKYGIRDRKILELRENIPVETTKPSVYLDSKGIQRELTKYADEVERLGKSRRPQLEEVGLFLKSRRVKLYGKNSISENLKTGAKLTEGQQRAYDALTKPQQEFLTEVSRTGVIDLYDDLYKQSVVKSLLEDDDIVKVDSIFAKLGITDSRKVKRKSAITQKFEDINYHIGRLKGMGYQGLSIEVTPESAKFIGLSKAPQGIKARVEWDKLRKKLGVDREGNPIATKDSVIAGLSNGTIPLTDLKDISYNDLLQAIAANRQSRYEINNRLSVFNFKRSMRNVKYLVGTVG